LTTLIRLANEQQLDKIIMIFLEIPVAQKAHPILLYSPQHFYGIDEKGTIVKPLSLSSDCSCVILYWQREI